MLSVHDRLATVRVQHIPSFTIYVRGLPTYLLAYIHAGKKPTALISRPTTGALVWPSHNEQLKVAYKHDATQLDGTVAIA